MRTIDTHCNNLCNQAIRVEAIDEPGCGGANHKYNIIGPSRQMLGVGEVPTFGLNIRFQDGPLKEAGVNGVTNEALLAVLIDRMRGFQRGPFACDENAAALTALETAMAILHARTQRRDKAGVEGTHGKAPGDGAFVDLEADAMPNEAIRVPIKQTGIVGMGADAAEAGA